MSRNIILKINFSYNHFLVDAINCYSCEILELYNLDDCNAFDDDTPQENCPDQNYCISGYGKVNGETDLEFHVCGGDFCKQNGNGCHDVEDMDYDGGDCYEGGDCVTDISYCCCDSDLCNGAETDTTETDTTETISDNGAEAIYFSVLTIALTVAMAM